MTYHEGIVQLSYVLGSSDPVSFSRGKRGLAGSIIFTVFDRDPMSALINRQNDALWYYAKEDELRDPSNYRSELGMNRELLDRGGMPLGISKRPPLYIDQLLPFDITITAQNEYGQMSIQRIYGVEILNAGAGLSVDDIVSEMQCTFVARTLSKWSPVQITDTFSIDQANFYDRVSSLLRTQSVGSSSAAMQLA